MMSVAFATGTAVDGGVGAVVPVGGCGITAAVAGAPPGVVVSDVVVGVCGCWPAGSAGWPVTSETIRAARAVTDRSTSTLRSRPEREDSLPNRSTSFAVLARAASSCPFKYFSKMLATLLNNFVRSLTSCSFRSPSTVTPNSCFNEYSAYFALTSVVVPAPSTWDL